MATGIDKLYADRHESFRRLQESLRNILPFADDVINLESIAGCNVCLDDEEIFVISKIMKRGDYVIVTHNATNYNKETFDGNPVYIDSPMKLSSISMGRLDELIRLMKRALIIEEIRSLN